MNLYPAHNKIIKCNDLFEKIKTSSDPNLTRNFLLSLEEFLQTSPTCPFSYVFIQKSMHLIQSQTSNPLIKTILYLELESCSKCNEIYQSLNLPVHTWDIFRLIESLTKLYSKVKANSLNFITNSDSSTQFKLESMLSVGFILKYPTSLLKNKQLNDIFTLILLEIQKHGQVLDLKLTPLPGVYLLCAHSNSVIRKWVQNSIPSIPAIPISSDIESIKTTISVIYKSIGKVEIDYSISIFIPDVYKALIYIFKTLSSQDFDRVAFSTEFMNSFFLYFHQNQKAEISDINLKLLTRILSKSKLVYSQCEKELYSVCELILDNSEYLKSILSSTVVNFDKVGWIGYVLLNAQNTQKSFSILISNLLSRKKCLVFDHLISKTIIPLLNNLSKQPKYDSSVFIELDTSILNYFASDSDYGIKCLSHFFSTDINIFWSTFFKLLDIFCINAKSGTIMIDITTNFIDVIAYILLKVIEQPEDDKVIDLTEEVSLKYDTNIIKLWFKLWTFVDTTLSISIKWLQSTGQNATIRTIISHTYAFAGFLTNMYPKIINVPPEVLSWGAVSYRNAIISNFRWLMAIDIDIRKEAVYLVKRMMNIAKFLNIEFGGTVKTYFNDIISKKQKTKLTDSEIDILKSWQDEDLNEIDLNEENNDEVFNISSNSKTELYPKSVNISKVNNDRKWEFLKNFNASQPISRNTFTKKQTRKTIGKLSRLGQIKAEFIHDMVPKPTKPKVKAPEIMKKGDESDEESDKNYLKDFVKETQETVKKSIKMIHLPNVKTSTSSQSTDVTKIKPERIGDISNIHKKILQWDYPPIDSKQPPNFDYSLKSIPNKFKSGQEYASIFEPLLILECWEHLIQSRDEPLEENAVVLKIESATAIDGFYDIKFDATSQDVRGKITESDIIHMTLLKTNRPGVPIHDNISKSCLGKISSVITIKNQTSVVCRIYPKNFHEIISSLRPLSCWSVYQVFSLTTVHREYSAITNISILNLCDQVLNPNFRKHIPNEKLVVETMTRMKANRPQAEAIVSASQQKSGFLLIQGPPGTGKTKTIMSVVGTLLTKPAGTLISIPKNQQAVRKASGPNQPDPEKKTTRLLLCTPSNAACDEIVRRLKQGVMDKYGKKMIPNIVRLGSSDAIHADVKDVTLEMLVEESFTKGIEYQKLMKKTTESGDKGRQLQRQLDECDLERDKLRADQSKEEQNSEKISDIQIRMRINNQKRQEVLGQLTIERNSKNENSKALDSAKRAARIRVLKNSDVVCCTLSAAGHEILSQAELEFPIVIVDEACQCTELGCLIPLKYGAKKCILVGDPNQLPPTVLSHLGQSFQYEQSLFQRIMKNLPDTVHLLNIQYRMHPQISALPSLLFYESKLLDGEGLKQKCTAEWHNSPLFPPYQFFNVKGSEVKNRVGGRSMYNPEEVDACVSIIESLCTSYPHLNFAYRIGVITPYKLQSRKIKEQLSRRFDPKVLSFIDINTVDGFQGQEKDIIILSCVRGGGDVSGIGFLADIRRMNVGLTRARCSLYVLGNAKSLRNNKTWKTLVDDAESKSVYQDFKKSNYEIDGWAPQNIYGTVSINNDGGQITKKARHNL